MTPTPNPTAEQIVAEAMADAGAPLMHSRVEEAVVAALRAHGLLSEGAPVKGSAKLLQNSGPSEDQIERAALAIYNRGRQSAGQSTVDRLPWSPRREGVIADARAALIAAGVAPQEPRVEYLEVGHPSGERQPAYVEPAPSPDREKLVAEARQWAPCAMTPVFQKSLINRLADALAAQQVQGDAKLTAKLPRRASADARRRS